MTAAIVAGLLIRRRRRKRSLHDASFDIGQKAELPGEGKVLPEMSHEGAVHEAHDSSKPPEAGNTVRAELETDWTGWEVPALLEVDLSRPRVAQDPNHSQLLLAAKNARNQADEERTSVTSRGDTQN